LEKTQKGTLDITAWLEWFLNCLDRALANTDETLGVVMRKARFWEKHSTTSLNDRQRTMLNRLLKEPGGGRSTSYILAIFN